MFRKNVPKVESLDDLKDARAKSIAHQHELDVREILPRYLELRRELMENGGEIEIDMDNLSTPLDIHSTYRRKLACGAVLSYELTQREALNFPVAEESAVIGIEQNAFLLSVQLKGRIYRIAPIEVYEQIGQYYEEAIDLWSKHQTASLNKVLDE